MHTKLNNVVESQTVVNILTCISQENLNPENTKTFVEWYLICDEVSFYNSFSIFVGRLLGPTDLVHLAMKLDYFI